MDVFAAGPDGSVLRPVPDGSRVTAALPTRKTPTAALPMRETRPRLCLRGQ
jgi:hypothetical protein